MNKVNKFFAGAILIFGLIIIGLSGYVVYDKILNNSNIDRENNKQNIDNNENNVIKDNNDVDDGNNDNQVNNDNNDDDQINNNDNNQASLVIDDEMKNILKELEEKFYDFYNDSIIGAYCGDTDYNDYISFGSYETNDFKDYLGSTKFKSISELKEYYKSIMVDELIPSYIDNGVSYIEDNGKLYCQLSHKSGGFTRNYDKDAEYTVNNVLDDKIEADVVFFGQNMGDVDILSSMQASITIIKKNDGNWVVSKYEVKM